MKKIIILILCLFVLTGCKNSIDKTNYDSIFDSFLNEETKLVNNYSSGYKYYLPSGVRVIKSGNYNEKLYYDGYDYYLFVDMVSYYYKIDVEYDENPNIYYSKRLEYKDNEGYVEIEKIDDLYKINVYYNYSSIETYVEEKDIGQTLINICYILNSIKFNDAVTELKVGNNETTLTEETFDFYTPRKEGNFIDYINKYDEYKEVSDENNIGNEGNE